MSKLRPKQITQWLSCSFRIQTQSDFRGHSTNHQAAVPWRLCPQNGKGELWEMGVMEGVDEWQMADEQGLWGLRIED